VNKRRILGAALIAAAVFTALNGWTWVLSYWDHRKVETYRGYDIYYFPEINVYGVDNGKAPENWWFYGSVDAAEKGIDSRLDDPVPVESYRGWTVYQEPGYGRYYAVRNGTETAKWRSLDELEAYLDGVEEQEPSPPSPPTSDEDVGEVENPYANPWLRLTAGAAVGAVGLVILAMPERRKQKKR